MKQYQPSAAELHSNTICNLMVQRVPCIDMRKRVINTGSMKTPGGNTSRNTRHPYNGFVNSVKIRLKPWQQSSSPRYRVDDPSQPALEVPGITDVSFHPIWFTPPDFRTGTGCCKGPGNIPAIVLKTWAPELTTNGGKWEKVTVYMEAI